MWEAFGLCYTYLHADELIFYKFLSAPAIPEKLFSRVLKYLRIKEFYLNLFLTTSKNKRSRSMGRVGFAVIADENTGTAEMLCP